METETQRLRDKVSGGSPLLVLCFRRKASSGVIRIYQEVTPGKPGCCKSCIELSRPVYLEIARDMAQVPCEVVVPASQPTPVDAKAVAECAQGILARLCAEQTK